eukprot:scpid13426/ scgid4709/ BAI1-associated protein 3
MAFARRLLDGRDESPQSRPSSPSSQSPLHKDERKLAKSGRHLWSQQGKRVSRTPSKEQKWAREWTAIQKNSTLPRSGEQALDRLPSGGSCPNLAEQGRGNIADTNKHDCLQITRRTLGVGRNAADDEEKRKKDGRTTTEIQPGGHQHLASAAMQRQYGTEEEGGGGGVVDAPSPEDVTAQPSRILFKLNAYTSTFDGGDAGDLMCFDGQITSYGSAALKGNDVLIRLDEEGDDENYESGELLTSTLRERLLNRSTGSLDDLTIRSTLHQQKDWAACPSGTGSLPRDFTAQHRTRMLQQPAVPQNSVYRHSVSVPVGRSGRHTPPRNILSAIDGGFHPKPSSITCRHLALRRVSSQPLLENQELEKAITQWRDQEPLVKDTHRFAVRTLLSRVGSVPEAGPLTTMNLLETLQDICLIGDERHSQVVSEESTNMQAGQQCLSVHVVEARSLAAKDPNGFSDPYVIIGMESKTRKTHRHLDDFFHIGLNTRLNAKISPMRMAARARSHSPPRSDQRQKTTSSMLGGGDPGHNEGMSRYKTTEVVYRSLNPKWDETFSMRVDDPNKAVLVLFVVDRDEGGARLPQLRGRKALANIVESVRSLVKAETDDFMGKIVIPIDSIPVRGRTDWFLLKDGEFHHLTKGEILLSIKYVPASRALAEDVSVEEAASLVKTLLKLMYTHEFMDVLTYKQRSPQQAFGIGLQPAHQCILDQVQAQLDITDADLTAMKLLAFHSLAMDHDIVPATRETVVGAILSVDQVGEKIPSASALSPYLAKDLSRTLDTLGNAMLQWGNRLHELFPPSDNASMDIIETLRVFKSVMALPFYIQHNQLSPDYARKRLETVLKDAVGEFYNSFGMPASYSEEKHPQTAGHGLRLAFSERIQSAPYGTVKQVVKGSLRGSKPIAGIRVNPEQVKEGPVAFLKARTDLIPELIAYFESTLQQYATYESLFERNDVKYTRIVIEALGAKIVEEVTTLVVMGTKHVDSGAGEDKKVVLSVMKTLIRLFAISKDVNKFTRRVIEKEVISVEKVFQPVLPYFVVTWTQVTSDHLSKAAELDPMSEVVDGQLYSYSAIDVCLIYNRVLADWDILSDWPDEVSRLMIMVLVVKLICEGCLSYSVLAHERIRLMEVGQALHPNDLIDQSAIIRNNVTYVIDHMLLRLVRWFTESSQASSSRLESGSCSSLDRGWKMFKRMPGSERRSSRRLSAELSDGLDVEDEECLNADEVSSFRSRCLGIVRKLVTTTEQHMDNCIQPAHRALLRKTMQGIERMLRKGQVEDAFNSLLGLISRAHGQTKIELSLRLRMVQAYWNSMLDVLARIINDTEKHEEFYTQCSVQLNGSFTALSELAPDSATANFATDQFKSLHTALKMYSEGPEQLQYQFFMMLRDAPPDDKWGSVTIQIGHVPNQVNFAMTNLRINLMHYQGLYATEEDIDTYAVYFQCHVLPSE